MGGRNLDVSVSERRVLTRLYVSIYPWSIVFIRFQLLVSCLLNTTQFSRLVNEVSFTMTSSQ